jgi:anti-sigma factor RsiW
VLAVHEGQLCRGQFVSSRAVRAARLRAGTDPRGKRDGIENRPRPARAAVFAPLRLKGLLAGSEFSTPVESAHRRWPSEQGGLTSWGAPLDDLSIVTDHGLRTKVASAVSSSLAGHGVWVTSRSGPAGIGKTWTAESTAVSPRCSLRGYAFVGGRFERRIDPALAGIGGWTAPRGSLSAPGSAATMPRSCDHALPR